MSRRVKSYRALNAIEGVTGMQFLDQRSIVDTPNFLDGLLHDLPHRVGLRDIGIDRISGTSILSEIILNHLSILKVGGFRIPPIRNENPLCRIESDSLDKVSTRVRASSGNQRHWIVTLLLESIYKRRKVGKKSTQDIYLRAGGSYRPGERCVVFRGISRVDVVVDSFDSTFFQKLPCQVYLRLGKRIILGSVGSRFRPRVLRQ